MKINNVEIIKAIDDDALDLSKTDAVNAFDRMIVAKQEEVEELRRKKEYFLNHFQAYWEPMEKPASPITEKQETNVPF
ncbi:hypothetical protein A0U90_06445 [Kozakia baliensis]|nr:hypothetical protein A0U90_06445 [Kozakia baliensis]